MTDDARGPVVTDERDPEKLPPLSEQMAEQLGGWRGLVESGIPVLVFIIANMIFDAVVPDGSFTALGDKPALKLAIIASVGVAVGLAGWRLAQGKPVRFAINGLVGIALGAILAWRSGEERSFYLPGIIYSLCYGIALLASVVFRQPLVGWIYSVVADGGKKGWRAEPRLVRAFAWLTVLWAATYIIKAGLQYLLYLAHADVALGIARIVLGYPPYLLLLALTVYAVRRIRAADAA
ncbi:MAG: DUF3159 domain-containing protein [Hamadaea sp.]|uniref:DUF3159 domain-containing protein n=1 Tax=Hamadaea sp. TaxID=2024425 RepID=UPI00183E29FD|nr:DUF3159 domain-containing protein [Hamadaea sp.]NUR72101.1 DUF3159 domain-containing protein [Hamadaea sp.]NUT19674.1 DUF3159 domain-containing protein [Hamadaea sp.]